MPIPRKNDPHRIAEATELTRHGEDLEPVAPHPDFVIFALQRTGSNMLVSALNSHPQITCLGELFRTTPDWMRTEGYRGTLRILQRTSPEFRDDAHRRSHAEDFIREVRSLYADGNRFGFKLMLTQAPDFMMQLIDSPACRKILLRRNNVLAAYSSGLIARKTGQGAARKSEEVKRAKVHFDPAEFEAFREKREALYQSALERLQASSESFVDIEYSDLSSGTCLRETLRFLEVDPTVDIEPGTVKRNPSFLPDRFDNPAEVKAYLRDNELEKWLSEGPEA